MINKNKTLTRISIFNLIYYLANALFPMIISIYVSRIILPDGVGKVAYALNVASYFGALASFGIPTYAARCIAQRKDNPTEKNRVFSQLFMMNAITTTIATLLYIIYVSVTFIGGDLFLIVCAGTNILINYINIDWLFTGEEEYQFITIRSITIKAISLLAVFSFVREKNDYRVYALITSITLCGNYLFNLVHAHKLVKFDFSDFEIKRHIKPVFYMSISVLLASIYNKIDITMLGVVSTNHIIGLYSNAHKIVGIVIDGITAISTAFLPRLSFYYIHDKQKFEDLIVKGLKITIFLAFPIAAGLFILAPQTIEVLYGSEFAPVSTTIRVFTPIILIKSIGMLVGFLPMMTSSNEKKRLPAALLGCISNVILNYLFLPLLYQNGAALASVLSEGLLCGYLFFAMRKIVFITLPRDSFSQALFTTICMGLIVWFITLLPINNLLKVIGGICIGIMVYSVENFMIRNEAMMFFIGKIAQTVKKEYFA